MKGFESDSNQCSVLLWGRFKVTFPTLPSSILYSMLVVEVHVLTMSDHLVGQQIEVLTVVWFTRHFVNTENTYLLALKAHAAA